MHPVGLIMALQTFHPSRLVEFIMYSSICLPNCLYYMVHYFSFYNIMYNMGADVTFSQDSFC